MITYTKCITSSTIAIPAFTYNVSSPDSKAWLPSFVLMMLSRHGRPRIIGFEIFAECRLIKKKISRLTWNILVVRLISIHLNVQTWLHNNTDARKSFTDLMSSFQFYLSCVALFSAVYFWIFCMRVSFFYLLFFVNVCLTRLISFYFRILAALLWLCCNSAKR